MIYQTQLDKKNIESNLSNWIHSSASLYEGVKGAAASAKKIDTNEISFQNVSNYTEWMFLASNISTNSKNIFIHKRYLIFYVLISGKQN